MFDGEFLWASLERFRDEVNNNARLRTMNKDWTRTIHVIPADADGGDEMTLQVTAGEVSLQRGAPSGAEIVLRAPGETLTQMFRGEISPTEPYLDGSLRIEGSQEDVLRLDFLSLMIWGE